MPDSAVDTGTDNDNHSAHALADHYPYWKCLHTAALYGGLEVADAVVPLWLVCFIFYIFNIFPNDFKYIILFVTYKNSQKWYRYTRGTKSGVLTSWEAHFLLLTCSMY